MIPKPLEKIDLGDLTDLIGRVREGKTIEYKSELPLDGDSQRKFLAGVSALANTSGGDFIIGIKADSDGLAQSVDGVAMSSVDGEKLRLEGLLRDGYRLSISIRSRAGTVSTRLSCV
jgi:predicted HTH transcriptional regulator